jgi:macrodomain Ter protein organizer (MatP/YcbG family)
MPFKSKAQRRKFAELLVEGKIAPDTFEEWNRETGSQKLPERVKRKAGAKRKSTKKVETVATRKRPAPRKRNPVRSRKKK